jgi:hypothetical protein
LKIVILPSVERFTPMFKTKSTEVRNVPIENAMRLLNNIVGYLLTTDNKISIISIFSKRGK